MSEMTFMLTASAFKRLSSFSTILEALTFKLPGEYNVKGEGGGC